MPKLTNTTALPLALTHTDDALLYIVDDSGGTPASKSIQAQSLRTAQSAYGFISCTDNATSQTVSADTWTKLVRFELATAGLQSGVTALATDGGDHYLRPLSTGYYLCRYNASVASIGSAGTITMGLYMNTTLNNTSQSAHKLDSNYTGNFSGMAIIDISDITTSATHGDISLWVKSSHTSLTLANAQLVIERLATT